MEQWKKIITHLLLRCYPPSPPYSIRSISNYPPTILQLCFNPNHSPRCPLTVFTSVSTQTELFTEITEIATLAFTYTPFTPTPSPPPTSSLGPILTPPSPRCQTLPLILVSVPISESPSGSTTFSRPQAHSDRLNTLQPRPYPPSRLRPEPEPPPRHGLTSRVRWGRRTLKRGWCQGTYLR